MYILHIILYVRVLNKNDILRNSKIIAIKKTFRLNVNYLDQLNISIVISYSLIRLDRGSIKPIFQHQIQNVGFISGAAGYGEELPYRFYHTAAAVRLNLVGD